MLTGYAIFFCGLFVSKVRLYFCTKGTWLLRLAMSVDVKVFGCRAMMTAPRTWGTGCRQPIQVGFKNG